MADESIWKKEVSFERKSEPPKDEDAAKVPAEEPTVVEPAAEPDATSKETLWKREVSFERTPVSGDEPADEPEGERFPCAHVPAGEQDLRRQGVRDLPS